MLTASENWARTPPAAFAVEPAPERVPFEQEDVADPRFGQVEGDATCP